MNNFWNLASSACGFLAINTKKKIDKKTTRVEGQKGVSVFLVESVPSRRVGTGLVRWSGVGARWAERGGNLDAARDLVTTEGK